MKPQQQQVWITDGKTNVKYAVTQLNYSQVVNHNIYANLTLELNMRNILAALLTVTNCIVNLILKINDLFYSSTPLCVSNKYSTELTFPFQIN